MRIENLEIENFKNFERLNVGFEPGVNLFVGTNGSGKTSLLEAVNVALGGFFGEQEQKMQRMIDLSEVRIKIVDGQIIRADKAVVRAYSSVVGTSWTRTFKSVTNNNDAKYVKPASKYGQETISKFSKPENRTIAPLIAYYSTQRLFKDASKSIKQKYDPLIGRRNGYLQCLKDNAIKGTLVEWLGNAVTNRATKQIKDIRYEDKILENVESAVKRTLAFFMEGVSESDIKLYQEADFDFELFVQLNDNFSLPINYYSDGFRNLIYLIIDLVWRSSQLNPWLDFEELKINQTGCVTIDEIDLHLHPKWQAKAISLLQEILPNVQFFITTHSPTVVANFEKGTLYVISEGNVEKYHSDYFGKEVNFVLRNVLGASDRHIATQSTINEILQLIDDHTDNDQILNSIEKMKHQLGADDPDVQKILALHEMAKFDG